MKKVLVTGAAGFIGAEFCKYLLSKNCEVFGLDNINNYYDTNLKLSRLSNIKNSAYGKDNWTFSKVDLIDFKYLSQIFEGFKPDIVVNLAAQAGVRYSIDNPFAYINSNIVGFINVLECCREFGVDNLIYASSSSVYGGNKKVPFSETDSVEHPVSLYAATKKSNELMAHSYSHLYNISCTGLRFFTVYGPWGRPDMAPMLFTKSILEGKPIKIFNNGNMSRDFTYIDDVVKCIYKLMDKPAKGYLSFNYLNPDPSISWAPHQILNVGNSQTITLMEFISELENSIGLKAIKKLLPMQAGDVQTTYANNSLIKKITGFSPRTPIKKGISNFIKWYRSYYKC